MSNVHDEDRKSLDAKQKHQRIMIEQKLVESGEKERLKELLKTRLIEHGWQNELRIRCKDIIKRKGLDNITMDELVQELTPIGRASVPDAVKKELLQKISAFLTTQNNI